MKRLIASVLPFLAVASLGSVHAQGVDVSELRSKGATVLSVEEMKSLISGANVRYQNEQFLTQMTLNSDGTLSGSSTRTGGAGPSGVANFGGRWEFNDKGLWCGETHIYTTGQGRGGGAKWCRSILKDGDKYYYIAGVGAKPGAQAYEMTIRK